MLKNTMLKIVVCCMVLGLAVNSHGETLTAADSGKIESGSAAYFEFAQKYRMQTEQKVAEIAGDETKRARLEWQMLVELRSAGAKPAVRGLVLKALAQVGGDKSVPVLASLLPNAEDSNMARYALQVIATDSARKALRSGLTGAKGELKIGIMNSLANMHDYESVGAIAAFISGGDKELAAAAVAVLGRMGGKEAVDALSSDKVPAELQSSAGVAIARCAKQFADSGEMADAQAIYKKLYAKNQPVEIRVIGLRGLVDTNAPKIASTLLNSLKSDELQLQLAAARLYAKIDDKKSAGKFIKVFGEMPGSVQAILLTVMADHKDSRAFSFALDGLDSSNLALQMSAIPAVAILGGEKSIRPLAEFAAKAERVQKLYARKQLALLRGESIDSEIIKLSQSAETAVRIELMEVLADRDAKSAIPVLFEATKNDDVKIAAAAFKALTKLSQPEQLAKLVELLVEVKRSSLRALAENAVVVTANKIPDRNQRSMVILKAWPSVKDNVNKVSLLNVMGKLSSDPALGVIRTALQDEDAEVKTAAIRALSLWRNTGPLDDLLQIAKNSDNKIHKTLAFRGYIQLTGLQSHDRSFITESMERYTIAMKLATDNDTRKLILAGLGRVKSLDGLNMVLGYVDDPALKSEAIGAVLNIAWEIREEKAAECKQVVEKILEITDNDQHINRAKDILKRINKILSDN